MTHTTTVVETTVFGNKVIKIATHNITSYTTGGEVINAADVGMGAISGAIVLGFEDQAAATVSDIMPEISATDGGYESGSTVHLKCILDNQTTGVPAEAANTTDMGFVRMMYIGHR